jgi:hypothetical protein
VTTPTLHDAPAEAGVREECVPRSVWRRADGTVVRDLHPRAIASVLASGEGALWVDVDSTEHAQHALLEKLFRFHPLAIEDTLNPKTRVKYEEYDGYLFVVMRGMRFCEETPDPYDLETINFCFFLGPGWLVTVHAQQLALLDHCSSAWSGTRTCSPGAPRGRCTPSSTRRWTRSSRSSSRSTTSWTGWRSGCSCATTPTRCATSSPSSAWC